MPRLKLHQIALALAVSAALTACGEKTAQTTETPQAASAASAADTAASTAAVSAPQNSADISAEDKALLERAQATFKPLPDLAEMQKVRPFTEEQVKLGQQLWYENRLSKGTPSAVTLATTWQLPAWTTCRPARATKANSAAVTPQLL